MSEHNTTRTDEAVCPHCGHEHSDTWEWFASGYGDGDCRDDIQCEECGETFYLTMHVDVSYTAKKPAAQQQKEGK